MLIPTRQSALPCTIWSRVGLSRLQWRSRRRGMPTEQKGGERLEHRLREQLPMFSPQLPPQVQGLPQLPPCTTGKHSKKHCHTKNSFQLNSYLLYLNIYPKHATIATINTTLFIKRKASNQDMASDFCLANASLRLKLSVPSILLG